MALRNIWIVYFLVFARNAWFWLGIWILWYLNFTNYSGIGLIETIMIFGMTVAEIPTGAIADLLGKKWTLVIAFLLLTVGNFAMGFAPTFLIILLSSVIGGLGATFYSGTIDALAYDTLKEKGQENKFDKVVANLGTIKLLGPAVCSVLGGFMYTIDPRYPFLAHGVLTGFGLLLTFLIIEPRVDTEKFSFRNFLSQTNQGFRELVKTFDIKRQTVLLLSIGFISVIADEMLNSFLGVEFGLNDKQLGILWAVIYLVAAGASQLTPAIRQKLGNLDILFVGITIALTFIISPFVGFLVGSTSLLLRSSFQSIYDNLATIHINEHTESKYRATTLSTFNMIKNIPYVLSAFFIGSLADTYSAKTTALVLGVLLLLLLIPHLLNFKKSK